MPHLSAEDNKKLEQLKRIYADIMVYYRHIVAAAEVDLYKYSSADCRDCAFKDIYCVGVWDFFAKRSLTNDLDTDIEILLEIEESLAIAIKKLEPEWMREYRANRKEVNMNETEKAQLEMKQEVREIVQSNDFKVIGLSTYGKSKTYTIVTNEED